MIRIENIKIYENYDNEELKKYICKKYKIKEDTTEDFRIYKKSVDARNKENVHFCISVDMKLKDESRFKKYIVNERKYEDDVIKITNKPKYAPVIIGSGPAGLFTALQLIDARHSSSYN